MDIMSGSVAEPSSKPKLAIGVGAIGIPAPLRLMPQAPSAKMMQSQPKAPPLKGPPPGKKQPAEPVANQYFVDAIGLSGVPASPDPADPHGSDSCLLEVW